MLNVLLLLLMISQVQVYAKMKENFNKINETKTVNMKTVLFRETDSFRDCWAHRDTSLLITRFQMQMLIPSEKPNEIKILLEYLTLCLSVIVQESKNLDKLNKSILTEALSDVLGGYINSYGLPFVYKMLYEGKAKMTMIEKLIDLSENFKSRLDTNGRGWTLPVQTESFLDNVKPAKIICNAYFDFCDTLIFDGSTLSTKNRTLFESCEMFSSIPLPILDNICKPNAIALPTKGLTLTNLNQFSAAKPILTVYYRSVICCGNMIQMNSKIDCTKERANFVNKFYNWLDTVLVTLLKDNVCHPPLIGILKLKKTVNQYMRNEKHDLEISKTRSKENIRYNSRDSAVGHFIYFIISFFITGLFWSVIFSFKLISDRGQDEDEHIQAIRFHDSIIDDSPEESNTDVRTRIKFTESFANKHTEDVTALYLFECNQKHYQSEFSNDGYDTDFSATN